MAEGEPIVHFSSGACPVQMICGKTAPVLAYTRNINRVTCPVCLAVSDEYNRILFNNTVDGVCPMAAPFLRGDTPATKAENAPGPIPQAQKAAEAATATPQVEWDAKGPGVWVSFASDLSSIVAHGNELDALRHAVKNGFMARFVEYGTPIRS